MNAKIFQKTINDEKAQNYFNLVCNFDNAEIEFEDELIKIKTTNEKYYVYKIIYCESDDLISETYHGEFEDGYKFILTKPIGATLQIIKLTSSAIDGFSIGSMNNTGWAVHFDLFE